MKKKGKEAASKLGSSKMDFRSWATIGVIEECLPECVF